MVMIVCQGAEDGTPCTFTGDGGHHQAGGIIQGECHPHMKPDGSGHGSSMCVDPDHLPEAEEQQVQQVAGESTKENGNLNIIIVLVTVGVVVLAAGLAAVAWMLCRQKVDPPAAAHVVPGLGGTTVVGHPVQQPAGEVAEAPAESSKV